MKKIVFLASAILMMVACKKTEEVKVDETKIETTGDTLTGKDTLAANGVKQNSALLIYKPVVAEAIAEIVAAKPEVQDYTAFGQKFTQKNVWSTANLLKKYKSMKPGDTIVCQFKGTVKEVCKKKGCWMSIALPGEKESFVRFKDYGFFVPKNADGSEAIVHGKAYLDVVSVKELQHYAKDGGKSEEEIKKITEPKITYAFMADGVLMR